MPNPDGTVQTYYYPGSAVSRPDGTASPWRNRDPPMGVIANGSQ